MIAQIALNDDSLLFIILMSTTILLTLLGFFFAFIQLYRRKQMEFQNEQKQREQAFSEELMRSQLELREKVMRQISDELHDNIGQSLIVAKMQLSSFKPAEFTGQIETAHRIIGRALQDVRSISKTLNGNYILREGLYEALNQEVQVINSSKHIACTISGQKPDFHFSAEIEVILFRCIQEVLSNALKHANASHIVLQFTDRPDALVLDISDNGVGLPADWENKQGLGMDNLIKRVEMIGGHLKVVSEVGKGTQIIFNLPKNSPLG